MDRRDFLKFSVATGVLVAAGEGIMENALSQAVTGITEADKVTIWVLAENYYDLLKPDNKITKRYRSVPGKSIHAEWGTGYFVETVVNGKTSSSSPIFYVLELNRGTCAVVCCGSLTIRPGWRIKMLVRPSAIL